MVKKFVMGTALVCGMLVMMAGGVFGSEVGEKIALPEPVREGEMSLLQALGERHSEREFDANADFTAQELANLLWATTGVNREDGRRVYPTALNVLDVQVYVFKRDGVYLFEPNENSLELVAKGDHREATGMQPFVKEAAVNLVYVQDLARWEGENRPSVPEESKRVMGAAHVGAAMQNAYLYSASQGWGCVVRGSFKEEVLREVMRLNEKQIVVLVQSVGPGAK